MPKNIALVPQQHDTPMNFLNNNGSINASNKQETPTTINQVLRMSFKGAKKNGSMQKSKLIQSCLLRAGAGSALGNPTNFVRPGVPDRRRSQTSLAANHPSHDGYTSQP